MNTAIVDTPRGKAFSATWHSIDIPWHDRFAQLPITIEVWAQPKLTKEWLVTCAYPAVKDKPASGWGLVIGSQGELCGLIVGEQSRWVWNHTPILDGQWHHLAMTFDGEEVQLYVDGKQSKQETTVTSPPDLNHPPGLQIGAQGAIICESLIQDVKLSAGIRPPSLIPNRLVSDEHTFGLWRLDQLDERSQFLDVMDNCPPGAITALTRESLDELERKEYHAGPAPLELPSQLIELFPGAIDLGDGSQSLSLDGQWQLSESNANWHNAISATVPGSVHTALQSAGKIPDPKFGLNDSLARENSFKTWWLRKTFARPAGNKHRLVFDGVAIHCTVWLNGEKLGEHEGMFGGPEFDISHLMRDQNELLIKLDPAPTGPPWFAPTANTGWKKTVVFNNVYGWHYSNIPALGIWRSVRVESVPNIKLKNPFIITHDHQTGDISILIDLAGPSSGWSTKISANIAPENFSAAPLQFSLEVSAKTSQHILHLRTRIPNPKSWWPNGLGPQNLYQLTLSIPGIDTVSTTFGLRTLSMAPLPGGERQSLYNWTFVINGRPTFLKGTGWCTMDSSMDFSRERYERFLKMAQQENCQMVRGWGSGMPETDDFYDLCDQLGITVLQEWPTAWNSHEEQPYDALEETVRLNTLRLRNHPSLLMWGGGNESSKPLGKSIDMMGRFAIELDGTRPFHRGEPWGGSDHNYACWWGKAHLDHNLKMTSRFFGEFGIASTPMYESVQHYLPVDEKKCWPPKPGGVFLHHTPVFNTMEDMDRLQQYAGYFSANESMERFTMASQLAQVVAVRHTLERARTRWPECKGALMYKLNDNYPAASWSTVDWYGAAKIGHYFVQDAFAPLHACILFDSVNNIGKALKLPVFLLDDADALAGVTWTVKVRAYNSALQLIAQNEFTGIDSIESPRLLGEFSLTAIQTETVPLLLVAEVHRDAILADRSFYFVNYESKKDCLFNLPTTTLSLKTTGHQAIIQNNGPLPAIGAAVLRPGHLATFTTSDNYFWLDAGESRTIQVNDAQGLRAEAWNARFTIQF